ncbi:hypothetical protein C8R43DRAFT_172467 [Mycena crocata]|nr:hypothetical protein C8R43DRAFT_172467 [Mycena crocata]
MSVPIPILNAPTEILQKIFRRCLEIHAPHIPPFSPAEAPLLLSRVCRLWRQIAITTPELWAHLSVSIGRADSDNSQPLPQLINTWIQRSGCHLLTLVIYDLGLRSSSAETANTILRMFLPHIHRWKSITFTLPNRPFPEALESFSGAGASLLQTAKLEFGTDTRLHAADTPQVAGLARLIAASSTLHTLYWRNDFCTIFFLDINWAQLTVVDLVPVWTPMSRIVQIMRKAPQLRSLSVFITEACHIGGPLVLRDLLILWIGTEADVNPLFQQLTVPSLMNINVFYGNPVPPVSQADIVKCIVRSGCSVKIAIFKSLGIFKADLVAFMRSSPSLLLLEISNYGEATITDDILALLMAANIIPCLCPNLRIIRFLDSSVSSTDGRLADMVTSRREVIHSTLPPLSRLVIEFSDAEALEHTEDIRRLNGLADPGARGLRVWINEPETA